MPHEIVFKNNGKLTKAYVDGYCVGSISEVGGNFIAYPLDGNNIRTCEKMEEAQKVIADSLEAL